MDHIIPREMGGSMFAPSNLRAACVKCNSSRNNPSAYGERPQPERSRAW